MVRYYNLKRIIKIHKFSNSIWHVSSRCPIDLKFYTGTQRKQIRFSKNKMYSNIHT